MTRSDSDNCGRLAVPDGPVVLCDVGDVLVRTVRGAEYRALERATGTARTSLARLVRASGIGIALERGELSPAGFTEELGRLVNHTELDVEQVCQAWQSVLAGADPLVTAPAASLAAAGRLVLASNTNLLHWPTVERTLREAGLVAPAYLSFELGYTKPDWRFFAAVVADLPGKFIQDCIFIDDRQENVEAATEYGMAGWLHRNSAATAAFLEAIADGDHDGPAHDGWRYPSASSLIP